MNMMPLERVLEFRMPSFPATLHPSSASPIFLFSEEREELLKIPIFPGRSWRLMGVISEVRFPKAIVFRAILIPARSPPPVLVPMPAFAFLPELSAFRVC